MISRRPHASLRRSLALAVLAIAASASLAAAHDLFLTLGSYFVAPGAALRLTVLNGTFSTSENSISRDRLADISYVVKGARARIDTTAWSSASDSSRSYLALDAGDQGTHLAGVSTKPRQLRLPGKEFNAYLAEEGLQDVLAERKAKGYAEEPSHERYAKHVKTLFQVGERLTDDFATVLGYPAEIVPVTNPYAVKSGGDLVVRCLVDGAPAVNVVVAAGGRSPTGERIPQRLVRSGADGTARIRLRSPGAWYVKFISMKRLAGDVNYESKWATLTFGVR